MKIFLDDIREVPIGWKRGYTADYTITLLMLNEVDEISLDHDLGDDRKVGTGYDVLFWIEKQVFLNNYNPPEIHIHTANPPARARMEAALKQIKKWSKNNE